MNFSSKDITNLGYTLQPDGSYARPTPTPAPMEKTTTPHPARVPHSFPKPTLKETLARSHKDEAGGRRGALARPHDPKVRIEPKKPVAVILGPQHRVTITRHAPRKLDHDNFVGGCKHLVDHMRRAHLIPDDDAQSVLITYNQEIVRKEQQRTEIEIFTPEIEVTLTQRAK